MPFAATWINLEIIILSEVSQTQKDKYNISLIHGIVKKMIQMNLSTKQTHKNTKKLHILITFLYTRN